jgi:hypothetical protein
VQGAGEGAVTFDEWAAWCMRERQTKNEKKPTSGDRFLGSLVQTIIKNLKSAAAQQQQKEERTAAKLLLMARAEHVYCLLSAIDPSDSVLRAPQLKAAYDMYRDSHERYTDGEFFQLLDPTASGQVSLQDWLDCLSKMHVELEEGNPHEGDEWLRTLLPRLRRYSLSPDDWDREEQDAEDRVQEWEIPVREVYRALLEQSGHSGPHLCRVDVETALGGPFPMWVVLDLEQNDALSEDEWCEQMLFMHAKKEAFLDRRGPSLTLLPASILTSLKVAQVIIGWKG